MDSKTKRGSIKCGLQIQRLSGDYCESGTGVLILGVPESQHLLSCPLQLLEMSFNCLEDVESTIPVSPLHLAVSPMSFSFASLVLPVPRP